jgi:very-short-patch-repair endonuclease
MLRNRRLDGLKFRRQQSIKPYFVDFYCDEAFLIVELDGMSHMGTGEKDDRRTNAIERDGYRVIRITNDDVLEFPDAVADYILRQARRPSPSPSESASARERVGESANPGEGAHRFGESSAAQTRLSKLKRTLTRLEDSPPSPGREDAGRGAGPLD